MSDQLEPMWFDPQFRARTAELRAAINNIAGQLIEYEITNELRDRARTPSNKKKFYLAVEALACNLLLLKATGSDANLAVPRAHGFLWPKGGNPNPVYGQHFLTAIDLLAAVNLIHEDSKGFRISKRLKGLSAISATEHLASYLPLAPPDWRSVHRLDDPALIILKEGKDEDGRALPVKFKPTARTKQWAGQIKRLNRFLRDAQIEIDGVTNTLALGEDGQLISPYRRSLRRIFNNKKWGHGGRLAGGFWMSMERGERKRIRIDGELSIDVDYEQLFPRLAYVRAQAEQPDDDIYDVQGDRTGRDGWKKLMNAMLFADGPLKNWPEDTHPHFPAGTKLRDAIKMLCQKHSPIEPLFGTRLGFELMRLESDIIIEVTLQLSKQGITALPLHDAVLVGESRAVAAQTMMQCEFERRTGCRRAIVKIKETPD
jgi:hypothetical protein